MHINAVLSSLGAYGGAATGAERGGPVSGSPELDNSNVKEE